MGDSSYTYHDPTHPAHAYFEDVYNNPEAYEDSASVLAIVGKAHRETGDYDLAISDFDRAIQLDPESPLHYQDRGIALYLNGDYNLAIADFNTSISILPDDAYLYLFRGLTYHMKGRVPPRRRRLRPRHHHQSRRSLFPLLPKHLAQCARRRERA